MGTFISSSPDHTLAFGETLGRQADAGWIIGLTGDLGSGKTVLVKGLARGLGVTARVHSPTFALVNEYGGGRLPLVHLDLYRLQTPESVVRAGLGEYFARNPGVLVVEWIEHYEAAVADGRRHWHRVLIEVLDDNRRRISHERPGA